MKTRTRKAVLVLCLAFLVAATAAMVAPAGASAADLIYGVTDANRLVHLTSEDAAAPVTNVAVLPLYFLSGVFIPESEIPSGVLHVAEPAEPSF
mgnify:CR=1 FL=1